MKNYLLTIILVTVTLPGIAAARLSMGAGVGSMAVSFDDDEVEKAPISASFTLGYQFKSIAPRLGIELSVTQSLESGTAAGGNLDVDSMGLYLVYRTSKPVYLKGRVGLMNAAISGNLAEDENGESYGAGIGWRVSGLNLEVEYTSIDDDISFLSAGFLYRIF